MDGGLELMLTDVETGLHESFAFFVFNSISISIMRFFNGLDIKLSYLYSSDY